MTKPLKKAEEEEEGNDITLGVLQNPRKSKGVNNQIFSVRSPKLFEKNEVLEAEEKIKEVIPQPIPHGRNLSPIVKNGRDRYGRSRYKCKICKIGFLEEQIASHKC